jgi:hypothetical protein
MSQDSQYAPSPEYGGAPAAPATPADEMSAPPQMSAFARLGNVAFSPGEVFEDVRRSPRGWWLPVIVLIVVAFAANFLVTQRLNFTPEVLAAAAIDQALEQQGKTRKDLSADEKANWDKQEQYTAVGIKMTPVIIFIFTWVFVFVVALVYWLMMTIMQRKTTYFRVLAVVTFAYVVPAVLRGLLAVAVAYLRNPDDIDPKSFLATGGVLTASPAALVSVASHPVLWTFLSYFDVFTIWFLALVAIGLAAVTVKRMKLGSALAVAVPPYLLVMLLHVGFKALTAR